MVRIKIAKMNTISTMLLIVALLSDNFAYLLPANSYIIPELIKFSDIGVLFAVIFILYILIRLLINHKWKRVSLLPFGFVFIILLSAFGGLENYGQPISMTIVQNRVNIISFLLFYPIYQSLKYGYVSKKNFIRIIGFVTVFELIVYSIQYVLLDYIHFTSLTDLQRYGDNRLYIPYLFLVVYSLLNINRFINGERKNSLYITIFTMFIFLVVAKYRAVTLVFSFAILFGIALWNENNRKKIIVVSVMIVIAIFVLPQMKIVQDTFSTLMNMTQQSETNTLIIRNFERTYYLDLVAKSPFIGFGEPNISCTEAYYAALGPGNYYLADTGIIGFYYCHGLIGVIWLMVLLIILLKKSIFLYKTKKNYFYLMYVVFELASLYMGMYWYYSQPLPFVMFLALLYFDYENAITEKGINTMRI